MTTSVITYDILVPSDTKVGKDTDKAMVYHYYHHRKGSSHPIVDLVDRDNSLAGFFSNMIWFQPSEKILNCFGATWN